jgi:hypothetical protein
MNINLLTSNQLTPAQRILMNSTKPILFACLSISVFFDLGRPSLAEPPAFANGPAIGAYAVPDLGQDYTIDSNLICPTASLSLGGFTGNGNDWANSYAPNNGSFSSSANNYGIAAGIRIPLNSPLADFCKEYALRKSQFAKISTENYRRNSFLTNLEQCRWLNDQGIGLKENSPNSNMGTSLGEPMQDKDGLVQDKDIAFMRFCQKFAYDLKDIKLPVDPKATIEKIETLNDRSQSTKDNGNSKKSGPATPQRGTPPSSSASTPTSISAGAQERPAPVAKLKELNQPTPISSSNGQLNSLAPNQSLRDYSPPQAPIQNFSTPNAVLQLQHPN